MLRAHKQSFDPNALHALRQAFDLSWKAVEADGKALAVDSDAAREGVAFAIMSLAAMGETSIERLAAYAVARIRYGSMRSPR